MDDIPMVLVIFLLGGIAVGMMVIYRVILRKCAACGATISLRARTCQSCGMERERRGSARR